MNISVVEGALSTEEKPKSKLRKSLSSLPIFKAILELLKVLS
jgi:hypothetical protein